MNPEWFVAGKGVLASGNQVAFQLGCSRALYPLSVASCHPVFLKKGSTSLNLAQSPPCIKNGVWGSICPVDQTFWVTLWIILWQLHHAASLTRLLAWGW